MAKMKLNHVALVCSSEQRADDFYEGVLELVKMKSFLLSRELARQIFEIDGEVKMKSFLLSRELARQIFEIDSECRVLVYGNSLFTIEVFLATPAPGRETSFEHTCVEVKKGDRLLTFVKDYDGNRFEVKELTATG
jgi:catechol 2,3-dioxygenase-like lactoylglutathione lyase family enzyme